MRKQQSIAAARSNLPQLVRQAESGEPIELTRRGESVAVLIGRKQYERLATRSRRFSEAWNEFTRVTFNDADFRQSQGLRVLSWR